MTAGKNRRSDNDNDADLEEARRVIAEARQLQAGAAKLDPERIMVDLVILTCNGCGEERQYPQTTPIEGAAALVTWIDSVPEQCECGTTTAEVRARLAELQ